MTANTERNLSAETPLESWKEVAAYLQRDVRTVIRWEKKEGLPVHRHQHRERSSVYAYASELDAWRANRKPLTESTGSTWWRPMPAFASTIVVALLLMMAGSGPYAGSLVQAAEGTVTRQVWSGAEASPDVAPSPNGRYLAFVDNETGDLAVRDLTTGQNRRLTNKKGGWENWHEYAESPVFSPDGKQVAFGWYNPQDECELRVVGMDGSQPRILYRAERNEIFPADWSQDGKSILGLLARTDQIVAVDATDGSLRILKSFGAEGSPDPIRMRFSPDGRFVVYDFPAGEAGNRDVFVLSVASGQVTRLVEHPAQEHVLGWAPNGAVLFLSNRTGSWGAWLISVADGKPQGSPRIAKRDVGAIRPMGFTRDGSFYYVVWDEGFNVYTAPLEGGTPSLLVEHYLGANLRPAWSPDGNEVAYLSRRSRGLETIILCVRSMKSGKEREYPLPELVGFNYPQWSPDGNSILGLGNDLHGQKGSYRIDLETGGVAPVLTRPYGSYVVIPRWSADGKAMYFIEPWVEETKRPARLMRRDLETGRDEQLRLLPEGVTMGWVFPSPDDRWLALWLIRERGDRRNLAITPKGGSDIRELPGPWMDIDPLTITWAPDSQQVLFMRPVGRPGKVTRSELWGVPVRGGEPRSLGFSVPRDVKSLSIHPDGRQIAFHVREQATEVWVMEKFLPPSSQAGEQGGK